MTQKPKPPQPTPTTGSAQQKRIIQKISEIARKQRAGQGGPKPNAH
ncbi:MAG TPA: hypothetical protein PKH92_11700 [Anaerolineaceae bacterium]|nr:hypothetical protein [Anaerolineaceae bacterium]